MSARSLCVGSTSRSSDACVRSSRSRTSGRGHPSSAGPFSPSCAQVERATLVAWPPSSRSTIPLSHVRIRRRRGQGFRHRWQPGREVRVPCSPELRDVCTIVGCLVRVWDDRKTGGSGSTSRTSCDSKSPSVAAPYRRLARSGGGAAARESKIPSKKLVDFGREWRRHSLDQWSE